MPTMLALNRSVGSAGAARPAMLATRVHTPARCLRRSASGPRPRSLAVRSSNGGGPGSFGSNNGSNDALFVAKLVAVSFAGAVAVKYGSLLTDIPFQPNAPLAMFLVLGPPSAYAALLWASENKE
ncbi:hypothetical protein TSOC_000074 [Tetrabaena socialis]|uniref:Uncharacterized protein n=1 Tax=Tetrabaena socialis TaxID=47790 RepID=A0A2J8AKE7_9CHLO|nr:hypothetical protein TSOC_000074 [Tetrabaena socialis]|eukprot:PNH12994.1 hypothetical protein TSOC_000074 [Tetrabaena socialis]